MASTPTQPSSRSTQREPVGDPSQQPKQPDAKATQGGSQAASQAPVPRGNLHGNYSPNYSLTESPAKREIRSAYGGGDTVRGRDAHGVGLCENCMSYKPEELCVHCAYCHECCECEKTAPLFKSG